MKLYAVRVVRALVTLGLARSNSEAQRLIKAGAVWAGDRTFDESGEVDWRKIMYAGESVFTGDVLRIGKHGNWRLENKLTGESGFDQLPGIALVDSSKLPWEEPVMEFCEEGPVDVKLQAAYDAAFGG